MGESFGWDKIAARNRKNSIVIPVPLQEGRAEFKEGRNRNDVVFENDSLLYVLEEPGDRAAHPPTTTKVLFANKRVHVAVPIDAVQQIATLLDSLHVARPFPAGTVNRNEEAPWLDFSQPCQKLTEMVGSVESDNKNRLIN